MSPQIKVHRETIQDCWYEVMLSPFKTEEEAWDYIKKYHRYYPVEDQNYRITTPTNVHYFRGCF
jgi:hypothetical protein